MAECDCLIPYLEGAGQHAPGCAVFREDPPKPSGDNLPVQSAQSVEEALRVITDHITELPPVPHGFRAHRDVPPGKLYKQWMTNGRLYVWCNFIGMVRLIAEHRVTLPPDSPVVADSLLYGIPIYMEDE